MTEKITNLELQIKKLLKENENCKRCKQIFDDIQGKNFIRMSLKKDLEILKGDLSKFSTYFYNVYFSYGLRFKGVAEYLEANQKGQSWFLLTRPKQIKNGNPGFF